MPKFDSKTFNAEVFQKYLQKVEPTKKNSLINSTILDRKPNEMARLLKDQVGGNYIIEPIKGDLTGKVQNYDGQTDIEYSSRDTFEQGKIVIGRMKGWQEKDFSTDISGEDYMPMAEEVKEYFDGVDFDDLIAVIKGIFNMADADNANFAKNHTLTVSALEDTTINEAITQAGGDKKNKYSVAFMGSKTALPLEKLQLVEYMKYTDANGITRNLSIGQVNGLVLIIDDEIPENTVYLLGDKFFEFDKVGAKNPDSLTYDPTTDGGVDVYSHKERTLIAPKYISFTKKNMATLSPTTEELADGTNWEVVNNGKSGSDKVLVSDKLIPIARIIISSVEATSSTDTTKAVSDDTTSTKTTSSTK